MPRRDPAAPDKLVLFDAPLVHPAFGVTFLSLLLLAQIALGVILERRGRFA